MAEISLQPVGRDIQSGAVAPLSERCNWSYALAWRLSSLGSRSCAVATIVVTLGAALVHDLSIACTVGIVGLVPAALVDVLDRRLPNKMVAAAAGIFGLVLIASISLPWIDRGISLEAVALGAGLMAGPLLLLHLLAPASMGFGDVKAAVVLGASVGVVEPQLALVALFVASGSTALVGLARGDRHLPFGPGLVVGAALALCCAPLVTSSTATPEAAAHSISEDR